MLQHLAMSIFRYFFYCRCSTFHQSSESCFFLFSKTTFKIKFMKCWNLENHLNFYIEWMGYMSGLRVNFSAGFLLNTSAPTLWKWEISFTSKHRLCLQTLRKTNWEYSACLLMGFCLDRFHRCKLFVKVLKSKSCSLNERSEGDEKVGLGTSEERFEVSLKRGVNRLCPWTSWPEEEVVSK